MSLGHWHAAAPAGESVAAAAGPGPRGPATPGHRDRRAGLDSEAAAAVPRRARPPLPLPAWGLATGGTSQLRLVTELPVIGSLHKDPEAVLESCQIS